MSKRKQYSAEFKAKVAVSAICGPAPGIRQVGAHQASSILARAAPACCAVIGIPQEDFGAQMLAFVVPRPNRSVDTGELASFLEPRLAGFKWPKQ